MKFLRDLLAALLPGGDSAHKRSVAAEDSSDRLDLIGQHAKDHYGVDDVSARAAVMRELDDTGSDNP